MSEPSRKAVLGGICRMLRQKKREQVVMKTSLLGVDIVSVRSFLPRPSVLRCSKTGPGVN